MNWGPHMYSDFVLIEGQGNSTKLKPEPLGETAGRNEAWLRDLLFANPELLPVAQIEQAFGPLVPVCKEMRTDAGIVDAVFMNALGRLTIVECKLWRNPEARRAVVGQILDYVAAISKWGYGDLQRQVSAAVDREGNIPFEIVRSRSSSTIHESEFIDSVSRSLREGRILALVVGDGIREEVQRLAETINRGASKAFALGIVEVAIYDLKRNQSLLIQPRVLLKTEVITRRITLISNELPPSAGSVEVIDDDEPDLAAPVTGGKDHLKQWWSPVLAMRFDDPEQPSPYWVGTNNVVLDTPFPGIRIKAYARVGGGPIEVFVSGRPLIKSKSRWARVLGRVSNVGAIDDFIRREKAVLLEELPPGTEIDPSASWPIRTRETGIENDEERRNWITHVLNNYVNALRPRLRRWREESMRG